MHPHRVKNRRVIAGKRIKFTLNAQCLISSNSRSGDVISGGEIRRRLGVQSEIMTKARKNTGSAEKTSVQSLYNSGAFLSLKE